jgi:ABC-type molybdate transport system ATPase subunit
MLEVDIEHGLGTFALDIHFRSGRGLTALFGRSGGGRTSVVNTIAGLIAPRFEAGAVLSARVAAHDARWGLTELAGAFGRLTVPRGWIYRSAPPCACESAPAT